MKNEHELRGPHKVPCAYCNGTGETEIPAEALTVETYYFGCLGEAGHYWHVRGGRAIGYRFDDRFPESFYIDGKFCPHPRPEVEGECALHHVEGWTVLAWWDRSVDRRSGSNSAIVTKGTYDFTTMLEIGKAQFPSVMSRQRQPLTLVEDHTTGDVARKP